MSEYPECEKLHAVSDDSQKIGEFLEWLKRKYYICEFWDREKLDDSGDQSNEGFYPNYKSIQDLLAEYFEIDMNKVEEERREILKSLQERN